MHSLSIGFLLLLLLAAAWSDIRSRRIPNSLVFPGAIIGVLLHALLPQEAGGLGVLGSLAGLGTGLALLLPLYLLRAMGAGDVKLMAMVGAFLGAQETVGALVCVLLAGGVLALAAALLEGKLHLLWRNLNVMLLGALAGATMMGLPASGKPGEAVGGAAAESDTKSAAESTGTLPYGVAIAAGTMAYLAIVRWN
ncbi:prepilin peptidase CpaA [Nitrosospira multiformis ATCC 25196]|uniref:Peptidase A24A, prepilin type IV n=1 Tax=Nitrosospira multiformis (strain ATCC 25196 / NCIMB 11849 / C 71) TaxID=323848 RepID=Q2Y6G8_NITMU|nr:A24 family peptidase [Nitrosospira multiformis]ABB75653.1 Peptidase A24A, prepilin type IV [Nitrosospira multiformis ATCC 25196]SEF93027.1 prepilin peptidase CpaA [Nitrosospira multiformis ATCC 25196]